MKLCWFDDHRLGVVEDRQVRDATLALDLIPSCRPPMPQCDLVLRDLDRLKPAISSAAASSNAIPLADTKLLSPVANPNKLIAAPVNYQKHLQEARNLEAIHHGNYVQEIVSAGLFLKAPSSLIGQSEPVRLRHPHRRTDHEIELAVIIGKTAANVPESEALNYVAGYSVGLDMTLRGPEERSFRKSIDTYSVLGPWMVTCDELPDPTGLDLSLAVNGEIRQRANTCDLIMSVAQLIAFATSFYTLEPGDVLFTGTPEGVGPVRPGDTIMASISGIGSLQVDITGA